MQQEIAQKCARRWRFELVLWCPRQGSCIGSATTGPLINECEHPRQPRARQLQSDAYSIKTGFTRVSELSYMPMIPSAGLELIVDAQ